MLFFLQVRIEYQKENQSLQTGTLLLKAQLKGTKGVETRIDLLRLATIYSIFYKKVVTKASIYKYR